MIVLKSVGAAAALRLVGLPWRAALGMGLGLSQLGEFSFLLVARGVSEDLISADTYHRMLFIAVASLVITPWLLRTGLRFAGSAPVPSGPTAGNAQSHVKRAIVIGIGPIGGQIASRLETMGVDLAMLDLSPVNLHAYAQLGFETFAGDARDPEVLTRVQIQDRDLAVVCVPKDDWALEIVKALRQANPKLAIIVRCRYQFSSKRLLKAGALSTVSEEQEAAGPLMHQCERWLNGHDQTRLESGPEKQTARGGDLDGRGRPDDNTGHERPA
jgi:CPA2 family monovalent cation:H+ antiporter-2